MSISGVGLSQGRRIRSQKPCGIWAGRLIHVMSDPAGLGTTFLTLPEINSAYRGIQLIVYIEKEKCSIVNKVSN